KCIPPFGRAPFLKRPLESHAAHAPRRGIEHGGYRLTYGTDPASFEDAYLAMSKQVDAWFSAGIMVSIAGNINDVRMNSPAFQAGLGPGTKLVAVNGHAFSGDLLKQAIRGAKGKTDPIE